jgi:hypothetical protein
LNQDKHYYVESCIKYDYFYATDWKLSSFIFFIRYILAKYHNPKFTKVFVDYDTPKWGDDKVIKRFIWYLNYSKCLREALAKTPPRENPIKFMYLNYYSVCLI